MNVSLGRGNVGVLRLVGFLVDFSLAGLEQNLGVAVGVGACGRVYKLYAAKVNAGRGLFGFFFRSQKNDFCDSFLYDFSGGLHHALVLAFAKNDCLVGRFGLFEQIIDECHIKILL